MAALLTVKSIQMTTATVTVNSEIVPRLNAYAAFTSSTPDAVIVAALEYVFGTDKEFIAFFDKHKDHPALLRVKEAKTPQKRRKASSRQGESASNPKVSG
jgi:hypothetical protein